MNIHPALSERRSLRAFSGKPVSDEVLHSLFEAARWAPSAFNEQPWRFVIARYGEASFEAMSQCLAPANRTWASNAAFLILVISKNTITRNGQPNRHSLHDTGLAVGNLTTQATVSGLVLHQMGGFDIQRAMEQFNIPADFEAVTIIAGGYPGEPESLSDELRQRETAPRVRKNLDEIVFSGEFGHAHPLFIAHPSEN